MMMRKSMVLPVSPMVMPRILPLVLVPLQLLRQTMRFTPVLRLVGNVALSLVQARSVVCILV